MTWCTLTHLWGHATWFADQYTTTTITSAGHTSLWSRERHQWIKVSLFHNGMAAPEPKGFEIDR